MAERGEQLGFPPVWAPDARALILGSYPSPKSFEAGFYYGHPQNRFWQLLAALADIPAPQSIAQKKALLLENHLALWDALARCRITGAADLSITDPVPNDIAALVNKTHIEAVFCNGAASHRFYTKFCEPHTGIVACRMPSTSPANAAWRFEKLLDAWAPLRIYMRSGGKRQAAIP